MEDKIETLWQELRELTLGTQIDRLQSPPTPLQFLRDYLSPNKPFILSAATLHWPATTLWSSTPYLLNTLSNSTVSLHLTPTGHADSLTPIIPDNGRGEVDGQDEAGLQQLARSREPNKMTKLPLTRGKNVDCRDGGDCETSQMLCGSTDNESISSLCFSSAHVEPTPFPAAIDAIRNSGSGMVAYAQQQNDCFREEYSALAGDCEADIGWATEAIGCRPEAVNLWVGNQFSVTSFHKDHYENIYAVVTGEKHFILLPPTDVHRMYIRDYPAAQYSFSKESGEFSLEVEDPVRHVPWCSVNPFPSPETREKEMSEFPLYFNGPKPFECTVKAGEILYLPSMWFHHVRQTPDSRGLTIAVNYWYDMRFDIKYAYFNFLQSIHHPAIQDTKLHATRSLQLCSPEDASNGNGYLTGSNEDSEDE